MDYLLCAGTSCGISKAVIPWSGFGKETAMELTNHFFLQAKNRGYNQRLVGKVAFVYILVSDPVSHWRNQSEVDACVQKISRYLVC